MLSSHLVLPRKRHLEEVFHVFAYLKSHMNSEIVFDLTTPDITMRIFQKQDLNVSIYKFPGEELKEELPPDMPALLVFACLNRVFLDAGHAGGSVTRRSQSGYIVFLNGAPIYWLSKKQMSCDTSTFGSKFVAMKPAKEYTCGL